jgi:hypothetical protein
MNVIEYLKEKYSVDKPTTMTTAEWKIFTNNAKPVLQTGWLKKIRKS